MAASNQDFFSPFDPTVYAYLTGAQFLQLITGIYPYIDKGLVVTTTDVAGNPVVPNAATTTKWQTYIWRRISAASVSLYIWSPSAPTDATYLNWVGVNTAGIPAGSIQGYMIAQNTIPSSAIISVDASQITGLSVARLVYNTTAPNAAGAIGGTFSTGLTLNNGSVGSAQIAAGAINSNTMFSGVPILPAYVDGTATSTVRNILMVPAIGGVASWVAAAIVTLAEPLLADVGKIPQVTAAGVYTLEPVTTVVQAAFQSCILQHTEASGSPGGTATTTAWTTGVLNTKYYDASGLVVSLGTNQVVLVAGTYRARITSPFVDTAACRIRLQNITDGATIAYGSSESSATLTATSRIETVFTIAAGKSLAVQYYVAASNSTHDLGIPVSDGSTEIYTIATFEKIG